MARSATMLPVPVNVTGVTVALPVILTLLVSELVAVGV
jgi:hypothetical protein